MEKEIEEVIIYKAIKLDENGYFTGTYIEGTDKKMLEMNGILVDEVPNEENQELWKAYKIIDGKWEADEDKLFTLKENMQIRESNEKTLMEMEEIKQELSSLDYKTIKFLEGELTKEEYDSNKEYKQSLREKYNKLEKKLK